ARGAAHVARAARLYALPARVAHDDREGPRLLAAAPRAPHRARPRPGRRPRLMDATIRVAEVPAARGASWLLAVFALFRQSPLVWIGLCAGWIVITFGLIVIPLIGGVVANFL